MEENIFIPSIHIKNLRLQNYRGASDIIIDFDERLTIIIGDNGSGKTTLLDGVALFLERIVNSVILGKEDSVSSIAPTDVKNSQIAALLNCSFSTTFEYLEKATLKELDAIIIYLNDEIKDLYDGEEAHLRYDSLDDDWSLIIGEHEFIVDTELKISSADEFKIARYENDKWIKDIDSQTFTSESEVLWNAANYSGLTLESTLEYNKSEQRPKFTETDNVLNELSISLQNQWNNKQQPLPIFAYYGSTSTNSNTHHLPNFKLELENLYGEVLSPTTFTLNTLYNWFRAKQELANNNILKQLYEIQINTFEGNYTAADILKNQTQTIPLKDDEGQIIPYRIEEAQHILIVKQAILGVLNDESATYSNLVIDYDSSIKEFDLKIDKQLPHETLPTPLSLRQLSSGEKHLIALVGDLAIRMIELNPKVENPLKVGQGIVLIDEIDLHLHPNWQRKIMQRLLKIFNRIQFVGTTHSPFITSVSPMIENNQLVIPKNYSIENGQAILKIHASGHSSDYILSELMDVDPKNPSVERYIFLIRNGRHNTTEGKDLKKIIDQLDPNSSDMMRINFALERFKFLNR